MRYLALTILAVLLFACSSKPDHGAVVRDAFEAYVAESFDDPGSYEFISVDRVEPMYIGRSEYYAAIREAKIGERRNAVEDSLNNLPAVGDPVYYEAWITFRANNRMGAKTKQQCYIQVQDGQMLTVKRWNEPLPEKARTID